MHHENFVKFWSPKSVNEMYWGCIIFSVCVCGGGRGVGEGSVCVIFLQSYSMFHVTWTTFKFNRNELGTVSAYVMCI